MRLLSPIVKRIPRLLFFRIGGKDRRQKLGYAYPRQEKKLKPYTRLPGQKHFKPVRGCLLPGSCTKQFPVRRLKLLHIVPASGAQYLYIRNKHRNIRCSFRKTGSAGAVNTFFIYCSNRFLSGKTKRSGIVLLLLFNAGLKMHKNRPVCSKKHCVFINALIQLMIVLPIND